MARASYILCFSIWDRKDLRCIRVHCCCHGVVVCLYMCWVDFVGCYVGSICFKMLPVKYVALFLVRNAFIRTNHCAVAMMFACLSGMGVHCDHTVHFSMNLNLWLDSPMFWAPRHRSMSTYSKLSFSSSTWNRGDVWMYKLGMISQWRLKIEVKLLLSANRKSCSIDWYYNVWPWATLNGRFMHCTLSLR